MFLSKVIFLGGLKKIYESGKIRAPIHLSGNNEAQLIKFFSNIKLNEYEKQIGKDIFREIINRLDFLNDVGVGYLTLERSAATLSGGEGQRIRLASQIGSGLTGVLYVLAVSYTHLTLPTILNV
mgnify:CR=1 FL=1